MKNQGLYHILVRVKYGHKTPKVAHDEILPLLKDSLNALGENHYKCFKAHHKVMVATTDNNFCPDCGDKL